MKTNKPILNNVLTETVSAFNQDRRSSNRKTTLDKIVGYANHSLKEHGVFKLVFVCTHNSRRSQMAQVWAFVLSQVYAVPFESYSGGVEVTTFHPNAIRALQNQGIEMETEKGGNPKTKVKLEKEGPALVCVSKLYDDDSNPKTNFAAIMVCDHADANCPLVTGADKRISLNYADPKRYDDAIDALVGYEATSFEIGNEMHYIFSQLTQP